MIKAQLPGIKNKLLLKYVLAEYFILYTVRLIIDASDLQDIVIDPKKFIGTTSGRQKFCSLIGSVCAEIIIDLNAEVDEDSERNQGEFYYRERLRDQAWVKATATKIAREYQKQIVRGRSDPLSVQWNKLN